MTLILLSGLLCDATVWQDQVSALQGDVSCFVPSYGSLDSIPAMAEHVLRTAPPGPLSLAGHSMGGRVALEMFRLMPQRIERLALMDTGYEAIADGEAGEKERAGRFLLLDTARRQGMRVMGRTWARGMVHPSRLESALFDSIVDMIGGSTPEVFAAQIHALLHRPDATSLLRMVRCPTLILCGREDAWSPLQRHENMLDLIRSSSAAITSPVELAVIERSGHMSTMEQPDQVNRAILRWLSQRAGE